MPLSPPRTGVKTTSAICCVFSYASVDLMDDAKNR